MVAFAEDCTYHDEQHGRYKLPELSYLELGFLALGHLLDPCGDRFMSALQSTLPCTLLCLCQAACYPASIVGNMTLRPCPRICTKQASESLHLICCHNQAAYENESDSESEYEWVDEEAERLQLEKEKQEEEEAKAEKARLKAMTKKQRKVGAREKHCSGCCCVTWGRVTFCIVLPGEVCQWDRLVAVFFLVSRPTPTLDCIPPISESSLSCIHRPPVQAQVLQAC